MIDANTFRCFNIILNNSCNLKCKYCDVPYIKNPYDMSYDDIFLFDYYLGFTLDYMSKNDFYNISVLGGEPGMLDTNILLKIIEICNKYYNIYMNRKNFNITIYTNGLVFDKIPNALELSDFHYTYHLTENNIKNLTLISSSKILYSFVINNCNSKFIIDYIKENKKRFSGINMSLKVCTGLKTGNIDDYNYDVEKTEYSKYFSQQFINTPFCNKYSWFFGIDLSDKTVFKCARAFSKSKLPCYSYKLNDENLTLALKSNLFSLFENKFCLQCKWYSFRGIDNIV